MSGTSAPRASSPWARIAGGGVALATWGETGCWILPAMCVAGILGGMAYAAIPAFLKARFDVSEILTSLMLTYVATLFLSILIYGPWKDPEGFNFPQSRMFTDCRDPADHPRGHAAASRRAARARHRGRRLGR